MNRKSRVERELEEWNKMKPIGRGKYIWRDGVLKWGISIAVPMSFIVQAVDGGISLYSFSNENFITRLIINSVVFSIVGYIQSVSLWKKYKEKYRDN